MKKINKSISTLLLTAALSLLSVVSFGQTSTTGFAPGKGYKQLNFGVELEGMGLPLYLGMDFGVGKFITIGPRLLVETESDKYKVAGMELNSRYTVFVPSFRGNYHFSGHISGLPAELDLYGGLSLGLVIARSSVDYIDFNGDKQTNGSTGDPDARLDVQLGGRYFFSDNWGAQIEFTTLGNDAAIGLSYRF